MARPKAPPGLADPFTATPPDPYRTPAPPARPPPAIPEIPVQDHLADDLCTDMVQLVVGTGERSKMFFVHKDIICQKASYFEKMFNGGFQEGAILKATFPEDEPQAFKFLIGWIYKGTIEIPQDKASSASGGFARSQQLIMLFILAEKLNITRLADETMDFLTKFCKWHQILPNPTPLNISYNNTRVGSKLRVWITRVFVHMVLRSTPNHEFWSNRALEKILGENQELLADVIAELRVSARKPHSMPDTYPECDYHQHAANEVCPYLKK